MNFILILLIGIISLCYTLKSLTDKSEYCIETYGKVVDFERKDRKSHNTYVPILEYTVHNTVYRNECNFIHLSEESMEKYNRDGLIPITVNGKDPNRFIRTKHFSDGLFAGSFFGFLLGASVVFLFAFTTMTFNTFVAPII